MGEIKDIKTKKIRSDNKFMHFKWIVGIIVVTKWEDPKVIGSSTQIEGNFELYG